MTVLVTAASKHGATAEIAEAIGRELNEQGVEATVKSIDDVGGVGDYDAFVLGSAVYMGHWLESAREFVGAHRDELASSPTWLFSSGPIGDPPRPKQPDAVKVDEIVAATLANGHQLFAGKLDKDKLGFGERAMMHAFRAVEGDYRDWGEIRAWAREIAQALTQ